MKQKQFVRHAVRKVGRERAVLAAFALVVSLLLALGPAAQAQEGRWQWQNPLPAGNSLSGVWGSSGSDVFAVGGGGTILHYSGVAWSAMTSGTSEGLADVWGSSGSDVFAVGGGGTILHYDGAAWSAMNSGTTDPLMAVWGSSGSDVFAVGGSPIDPYPGTVLHYNGTSWSAMSSGASEWLNGVWGSSGSDVFAVGDGGIIMHHNGTSWSVMSSGTTDSLYGVWGSSGSEVFAVGAYGPTILHYDGAFWSTIRSGPNNWLNGVWGSSSSDAFAVGWSSEYEHATIMHYDGIDWYTMWNWSGECELYDVWSSSGSDVFAVGQCGTILHYNGISWSTMSSGPTDSLHGVWGSGSSDVYAVGDSGTVLRYDGAAWNAMDSGTTAQLYGVWGSSGSDIFAVGLSGTILRYDGAAWSAMDSGTTNLLFDVWGSSGSDVFAVGGFWGEPGTILHYDGVAWSAMSSGTTEMLWGVWGSSDSDVFTVGTTGTILHYNGVAWSAMSSGTTDPLYGVWGSSDSDILAVGQRGTILHYDGAAWNAMSCGTTKHFSGVWGSSGSDVFAVGQRGTILHYDGAAWSAMDSGASTSVSNVWGSSGSDVFAVGDCGTILHYAGSMDLALVKAVQPGTTVLAGEPITFTLAFSYVGTVTATGVLITDVVPVEVTQVAFDSSRPVTPTGTVSYTWQLGDLAPGAQGVITITGVVSPGLSPGHAFANTAAITSPLVAGGSDWVRVSIQAAPTAVDDSYLTTEDMPLVVAAPGVLGNDNDPNGDPLTAVLGSPPLSGTLVLNPDGSFIYTPTLNFGGVDSFTYHATDAMSSSNLATVTLTVLAENDAPVAVSDGYTTTEDMPLIVAVPGVLANDGDVEGDPLAAVLDSPPANGLLALNSDGSFTYTPTLNFNGEDSFTYHATDAISDSNVATVTLTVLAENDAPVAASDSYTTTEDVPLIVAAPGVLGNDGDVDGDALTAMLDSPPANGILALNLDGSFTYTPTLDFNGIDAFTYHATDTISDSNLATVTLTVLAENDAPVAASDSYTTGEDVPLIVSTPGVLGNDADVEGDPLTAVLDHLPLSGTLTLNLDGSFIYTPTLDFHGVDAFTYHATDMISDSNVATVTLTVETPPFHFVYLPLVLRNE